MPDSLAFWLGLSGGTMGIGATTGFLMWRSIHQMGGEFWKLGTFWVWVGCCLGGGLAIEGLPLAYRFLDKRDVLAQSDFPDAYEFLAIAFFVWLFVSLLAVAHTADARIQPEHSWNLTPKSGYGLRRAAIALGFLIYIVTTQAGTSIFPVEDLTDLVPALSLNAAVAAALLVINEVYQWTWNFVGPRIHNSYSSRRDALVEELVDVPEERLVEPIRFWIDSTRKQDRVHDDVDYKQMIDDALAADAGSDLRAHLVALTFIELFHFARARKEIQRWGKHQESDLSEA